MHLRRDSLKIHGAKIFEKQGNSKIRAP